LVFAQEAQVKKAPRFGWPKEISRLIKAARAWDRKRQGLDGGGAYFAECDELAAAVKAMGGMK